MQEKREAKEKEEKQNKKEVTETSRAENEIVSSTLDARRSTLQRNYSILLSGNLLIRLIKSIASGVKSGWLATA